MAVVVVVVVVMVVAVVVLVVHEPHITGQMARTVSANAGIEASLQVDSVASAHSGGSITPLQYTVVVVVGAGGHVPQRLRHRC